MACTRFEQQGEEGHVDATGRLVGRRSVLSNMPDVEWLELKRIFLNTSIESLNAVCFSALTGRGGHLQTMCAALFMLMSGPAKSFVTLRTMRGKVIGIMVPIMGLSASPKL